MTGNETLIDWFADLKFELNCKARIEIFRARIVSLESGSIKAKVVFEFDERQNDLTEKVNQALHEYLRSNGNQVGDMVAVFDASQTEG